MMCTLFLLFLLTTLVLSNNIAIQIVDQFPGYDLSIYYDNQTIKKLDGVLQFSPKRGIRLINNDLPYPDYRHIQGDIKKLHLILLENPLELKKNSLNKNDLKCKDIVVIVTEYILKEYQQTSICDIKGLYRANSVFIFDAVSLRRCCFYCGVKTELIKERDINIKGDKIIPQLSEFFNDMANFRGHLFKIGFAEFLPYFYCRRGRYNQCRSYFGPEFEIVKSLSKTLNFRYEFVEFKDDGISKTWPRMLSKIQNGEISWAVSIISQTLSRTETLDFTRYIRIEKHVGIYAPFRNQWKRILELLNSTYISSIIILLAVGVTALGLAVVHKLSLTIFGSGNVNLPKSTMLIMLYVVEQQNKQLESQIKLSKMYIKIVFLLWWVSCSTISTYYRSNLTSFFMTWPTDARDVEDMYGQNFEIEMDKDSSVVYCRNSSTDFCTKMSINPTNVKDDCGFIKKTLLDKSVYIEDELSLQFFVMKKCNLSANEKYSLRIISANAFETKWNAFPMKRYTPFVRSFSKIISRLDAAGLLLHWYQKELQFYNKVSSSQEYLQSKILKLNLGHFIFPFTVLLAGNLISIIVYVIELQNVKF